MNSPRMSINIGTTLGSIMLKKVCNALTNVPRARAARTGKALKASDTNKQLQTTYMQSISLLDTTNQCRDEIKQEMR